MHAVLAPLLDEAHTVGAHGLHADHVDVAAELGHVGREVRGAERGVDFLDDLAARLLEGARPRQDDLQRAHAVGGDDRGLLGLEVLVRPRSGGTAGHVPGVGDAEHVGIRLQREVLGHREAGDQQRDFLGVDVVLHGDGRGGEHDADHGVHAVLLGQLADLGDRDVRADLIVLHDQLELAAAELAAGLRVEELGAVDDVLGEAREDAGDRREHADLDRRLGQHGRGRRHQREQ